MKQKKTLTKKEIDQFCRTVIYHLIGGYDIFAFDKTVNLSQEEIYAIIAKMKFYASKFETELIGCGTTNSILDAVRNSGK
jgi:hypothetical protein|nr:MAG TPA: hypothetical protein [Inoviridae sp.]